jgi:hypothetical protein
MKGYQKSAIRNISALVHLSNGAPLAKSQDIIISQRQVIPSPGHNSDKSGVEICILQVQLQAACIFSKVRRLMFAPVMRTAIGLRHS